MVPAFTPMAGSVTVAATASSVSGAIVMPAIANALYVVNTSATLQVTVAYDTVAPTAVLFGGATLGPNQVLLLDAAPSTAFVAAIGSGAGPTNVIFTPACVRRG